tara:strand:+ start:2574 stop:2873 length:300 start_codon:yes stop_codon:yes gene_type:complete
MKDNELRNKESFEKRIGQSLAVSYEALFHDVKGVLKQLNPSIMKQYSTSQVIPAPNGKIRMCFSDMENRPFSHSQGHAKKAVRQAIGVNMLEREYEKTI